MLGRGELGGIAEVKWDDGRVKSVQYVKDIELGNLEVEDSLSVTAWPRGYPPDELTITHNGGRIPLALREPYRTSFFGMIFMPIAGGLAITALAAFIAEHLRLRSLVSQYANAETSPATNPVGSEVEGAHDAESEEAGE